LLAIELLDELVFGVREAAWPLIREDVDLSYAEIGLLLAIPNLVSAVVEPVIGILGDVWRRRVLIVGGGVAFAGALLGVAASESFLPLLLAFAVLYPASGAFVSLSQASLMDAEPARRELNMVRWTIAGSVGALAGPAAVSAVAFLALGWRPVFVGLAAAAAVLAMAAVRVPSPPATARGGLRGAWRALRRRPVLRWLVLLETSDLLLDVFYGFLALYLVDEAGFSRGAGALALTVVVGAGLAGDFVLLRLLRRVSGLIYLRLSAVAAAGLFALFLLVPGDLKLVPLAALGLATAGWYPILKARLYGELPGRSGLAMTLGSLMGPLGSAAPLAVGFVAEGAGLGAALWLLMLAPLSLLALSPLRDPRPAGSGPSLPDRA
jgi:MFS transporter, FSR family, fosmidomycin resistance protein